VHRQLRGSSFIGISATRGATAAIVLALSACGGSSNQALTLSGTVSGLTTGGLALASNGVNLPVASGATSFTFGPVLSDAVGYNVIVGLQPLGQFCSVTNGSGIATTANITNVVVTCSDRTFTVGGTIKGLTAPGLVLANGSDTLSVPAGSTSFTLPMGVAYGSSYKVTVATQPSGLTCDVSNGSGTMSTAAVTTVSVTCGNQPMTVGGSIRGLGSASGLVLFDGVDAFEVPAGATSFTREANRSPGDTYAIEVRSQPAGLTCSASPPGIMPTHDVTDVAVTCSDEANALAGRIEGLTAAGLVLSDGTGTYRVPANAGHFTMPTLIADGGSYALSVESQPQGLTCTISGASGTMPSGGVLDIRVTCASTAYTLGGSISGLRSSGLVLSDGTDDLAVSANAARFSMPNALAEGSSYAVTIRAQPEGGSCRVSQGTGTMAGEVGTIVVACEDSASQP
jgi:hypothetical protein